MAYWDLLLVIQMKYTGSKKKIFYNEDSRTTSGGYSVDTNKIYFETKTPRRHPYTIFSKGKKMPHIEVAQPKTSIVGPPDQPPVLFDPLSF